MEITLDQLLASREARASFQRELLSQYPDKTLVCLTVIMPGTVKRNLYSLIVAQAALCALIAKFSTDTAQISVRDLETGFEAYLLTPLSVKEAKGAVCYIEDTHPLGRLFDLDVIAGDGIPVSRSQIGAQPRKCLICDNEARYCMRSKAHTNEELLARIKEMVEAYVQ